MKKLLFIICLLLVPSLCFGDAAIVGGVIAAGKRGDDNGCLSATYMSSYDGDVADGADYICINGGMSTRQASSNTADSVSADYVSFNAVDENLIFVPSSEDIIDGSEGTIYFDYYIEGTRDANVILVEVGESSAIAFRVQINSNGYLYGYNNGQNVNTGANPSEDVWYTAAYTWTQTGQESGQGHAIGFNTSGSTVSWADTNGEAIGNWTADELIIGEKYVGVQSSGGARVRNLIVLSGYKTADPR